MQTCHSKENKIFGFFAWAAVFCAAFLFAPHSANAAALLLSPSSGTFTVDSTFDVSIILDTQGKSVNALDVDLRFPADKIQLVSPKTSVSVISVWTSQPQFNNQTGRIHLQGGIPRGVNLSNALVATITFRVKSVGSAILRFSDESKVLLNDGLGTDDLSRREDAVYTLVLPPPAGPVVVSETHPDQSQWYPISTAILKWASEEEVQGYSYILNDDPVTAIDDTSEGVRNTVSYKTLADGRHYFHIKSLREGAWGGSTHFGVKIDTEPPARFPVDILPGSYTSTRDPVIKFSTTDALSGLQRYELKVVPLTPKPNGDGEVGDQPLFIEVESPYIAPKLDIGPYDVIVRAYDNANNYQEVVTRLTITDKLFGSVSREGIFLFGFLIPWFWIIILLIAIILGLLLVMAGVRHWHVKLDKQRKDKELPDMIRNQLEDLKRLKGKYTVQLALLFMLGALFAAPISTVFAQQIELAPPLVTTVSRNVSNNEIFYVGGKTESADTDLVLYTQNLSTGETQSYALKSDKKGEWFYRHNAFLSTGRYLLWTQAKIGEQLSPPSPQIEMQVGKAALQFGVSRISYETLYMLIIAGLLIVIVVFIVLIVLDYRRVHRKHLAFKKEFGEVEESIRRGFAVLRRDIQKEIEAMQKLKLNKHLVEAEEERERQLLRDLEDIERRIGKELWDVQKTEDSA
jgi:uncharacterized membrane protein